MVNLKDEKWFKEELYKIGALVTDGHLVLPGGNHTDKRVNLGIIANNTELLVAIGGAFAAAIHGRQGQIAAGISTIDADAPIVIVGVGNVGRALAQATATAGNFGYFVWCDLEQNEGKDYFRTIVNGFGPDLSRIIKGSNCYIVDGALLTAVRTKTVSDIIEFHNGKVAGLVTITRPDKSITAEKIGVQWHYSILDIGFFDSFEVDEEGYCPICNKSRPMEVDLGLDWAMEHPNYPVIIRRPETKALLEKKNP